MAGVQLLIRGSAERRIFRIAMLAGLLAAGVPAAAEPGILLVDARPGDSEALATGDQLLLTGRDGALRFAGRELRLAGFSGIVGYASEVAYVVVIDGEARDGAQRVSAGRMLLIPPYGAAPSVQRFDAERLLASWSQPVRDARPEVAAQLAAVARRQRRGIFFGRLAPTRFNVAASGQPGRELGRRATLGSPTVRSIRFGGTGDAATVERRIVDAFRRALLAGDAQTVAALMDPMPFGGRALAGGAAEARLLAARALIASRDWQRLLGESDPVSSGGGWRMGGATLVLRRIDDFAFVQRIGEAS